MHNICLRVFVWGTHVYIHTYSHTYMHKYIHTQKYTHTYIHTYMRPHMMQTCVLAAWILLSLRRSIQGTCRLCQVPVRARWREAADDKEQCEYTGWLCLYWACIISYPESVLHQNLIGVSWKGTQAGGSCARDCVLRVDYGVSYNNECQTYAAQKHAKHNYASRLVWVGMVSCVAECSSREGEMDWITGLTAMCVCVCPNSKAWRASMGLRMEGS